MKDNINLDELLKQELGGLSPEPPADVWQTINNSLPTSTPAATSVQAGISLTTKVVVGVVAAAAVVATVVYMSVTKPEADTSTITKTNAPSTTPDEHITQEEKPEAQVLYGQSIVTESGDKENNVKQKSWSNGPKKSRESQKNLPKVGEIDKGSDYQGDKTNVDYHSTGVADRNNESQKAEANESKTQESKHNNGNEDGNNTNAVASEDGYARPEVPNVFTPNNDGYNDEYVIIIEDEVLYDLKITDVKGNVVFESHDKNVHWKGINPKTGNICEPGFYILAFRYQLRGMKEPKVVQARLLLKL